MKIRNRKGFTLVELLITIIILGIITGMSIPLIKNIKLNYEQKKYNQYGESLLAGAKLYKDSYEEDLFGHKDSGCSIVSFDNLFERELIKDFPDDKISCNDIQTLVRVVKIKKKYGYSYELYCGDKGYNGKAENSEFKSSSFSKTVAEVMERREEDNDDSFDENGFRRDTCNKNTVYSIDADPESGIEAQEKYNINLKLTSYTGVNTNKPIDIQYTWARVDSLGEEESTEDEEESTEDDSIEIEEDIEESTIDYNSLTGWKKVRFKVPGENIQQKEILKGNPVEIKASTITTPKEADYYVLVLKVNNFQDLIGETWGDDNNYLTFGVYNVAEKYTITYDNNGGTGCTEDSVLVTKNEKGVKTWEDLCTPTRTDYSFIEWNTKKTGDDGVTIDESTVINGNLKVYARWEQNIVIFKIKVYSSGNPGEVLTASTTGKDGTKYSWNTSNNILRQKIGNGSFSIYTYRISKGNDSSINLPDYNNKKYIKITKTGFVTQTGKEWLCESGCVDSEGNPIPYTFSQANTTINTNDFSPENGVTEVYLRVNWILSGLHPVTLDHQGGSGGTPIVYERKGVGWYANESGTGSKITTITAPTKKGYKYAGYYTKKNGGGTKRIDTTTLPSNNTVSGPATWYAKWTPKILTISINHHGGTGGSAGPIYLKYANGWFSNSGATSSITKITPATKTGYTLSGYYNATSGGTKITDATGKIVGSKTSFSSNGTIHARWGANVYKVTLNKSGGSGGTPTIYEKYNTGWYSDNAASKSIAKVTLPTNTGHKFGGYYTKSEGAGTKIINEKGAILSGKTKTFKANGTLYAKWIGKKVVVTFNCNGGSGGGTQTFTYGVSGQRFSKTCTRSGYTTTGWSLSSTATTSTWSVNSKVSDAWINQYSPSVTLYADWHMEKPATPTITNEHGNKWVKSNYDITIKTSTASKFIGTWYYKVGSGTYKAYDETKTNTLTKRMSTNNDTVRNNAYYIKVCNIKASGPSDTVNCSSAASTRIKIDKEKPVVKGYNMHAYNVGSLYGTVMTSSECAGNTKVTGHCDSAFKVTCHRGPTSCNWSFDYEYECSDGNGSGCVANSDQIKWDHNGWDSYKCLSWTTNSNCALRLGDIRATWTKLYVRMKDNAGNYSDEFYFYQTCKWCNDVPSVCS